MNNSLDTLAWELRNNSESAHRIEKILAYLERETINNLSEQSIHLKTAELLLEFKHDPLIIKDINASSKLFKEVRGVVNPDERTAFLDAFTDSILGERQKWLSREIKINSALILWLPLALKLWSFVKNALMKQAGKVALKLGEKMVAKQSGMVLSKFVPVLFLVIDAYLLYSTAQDVKRLLNIKSFTDALKDESQKEVKDISVTGEGKNQLETLLAMDWVNEGKSGADIEWTLNKINKPFTLHIKYSDGSPETTYTYLKWGLLEATTHDKEWKSHTITADDMGIDVDSLKKPSPDWTIRACQINRNDQKKFPNQETLNMTYEFICWSLKSTQNWTKMDYSVDNLGVITLERKENNKTYAVQVIPDPTKSDKWKMRVKTKSGNWSPVDEVWWWLYQMIVLANLWNKLMSLKEENDYDEDEKGKTFSIGGTTILAKNDYWIIPNDTVVLWKTSWSGFDNQESEWSKWFKENMKTQQDVEGITKDEVVTMANSMSRERKK